MYNQKVLDEFYNPQNVGVIKGASGKGKTVCDKDGEIFKIYVSVENGIVVDAQFQTFGCVAAIAATSVATRFLIGKTLEDAKAITVKDILSELGGSIPESKMHCVEQACKTAQNAIKSVGLKNKAKDDDDE